MNEMIVGIDPGLHCGFALLDGEDFNVWEFRPMEACDRLYNLVNDATAKPIRVSCERFTQNSTVKTGQNDALEIIGVARWICHRAQVPFAVVGAADASKGADTATLKKLGFWLPGKPDHYKRAAAQVAYTLKTVHPSEFLARLKS